MNYNERLSGNEAIAFAMKQIDPSLELVACGSSTMLETMSENSAQPSLLYAGTTQAAGTEITLHIYI